MMAEGTWYSGEVFRLDDAGNAMMMIDSSDEVIILSGSAKIGPKVGQRFRAKISQPGRRNGIYFSDKGSYRPEDSEREQSGRKGLHKETGVDVVLYDLTSRGVLVFGHWGGAEGHRELKELDELPVDKIIGSGSMRGHDYVRVSEIDGDALRALRGLENSVFVASKFGSSKGNLLDCAWKTQQRGPGEKALRNIVAGFLHLAHN